MKKPIRFGNTEVTLHPEYKFFSVAIYLQVTPFQMQTPETLNYVAQRASHIVRYMVAEGFIPDPTKDVEWQCAIAGIAV